MWESRGACKFAEKLSTQIVFGRTINKACARRRCPAGRRFGSTCPATRVKTKAADCFRRTRLSVPGLPVTSATSTPRRPAPGSRALRGVQCARGLWPLFARASAASSSGSISVNENRKLPGLVGEIRLSRKITNVHSVSDLRPGQNLPDHAFGRRPGRTDPGHRFASA
jgi:hypothetical protein